MIELLRFNFEEADRGVLFKTNSKESDLANCKISCEVSDRGTFYDKLYRK